MKKAVLLYFFFLSILCNAQNPQWTFSVDSVANLSSARSADLNNDGIPDIVFGAGKDGAASTNGIVAVNGSNGQLLWKRPARNEVFGSAIFQDITADGIPDVFITGRQAQMLAINGANGQLIWDFFPYNSNPADSGYYNFYNPTFVSDFTNDGIEDILVSNGGDHAAPVWVTDRPAGLIMLLNSATGEIVTQAVVPDSAEIYCSPVIADLTNDNDPWILYGTGGETLGGHFYACRLSSFLEGSLESSSILAEDSLLGFVAPASVAKDQSGNWKIFIQSYGGTIYCINGNSFETLWSSNILGAESSAALTLGNFVGNLDTDAFAVLYKGIAPSYTDFYQVMFNGSDGSVQFMDSLGSLHFASANAVDLNNDGRDEVLVSTNEFNNGSFKNSVSYIDFTADTIEQLITPVSGVNLASTPLIIKNNVGNNLELFILTRRDSLNPSGLKGVSLRKYNLNATMPNSGIAWGSYMGSFSNGEYNFSPSNCGTGSIGLSASIGNPTCNGLENGSISPILTTQSGPFTYSWSDGSIAPSLSNIGSGNYQLRVINAAGCYEDISYSLIDPYEISFGNIVPPNCPGKLSGQATLNSSGCQCMFSTCTFLWENGVTTKPNSQLPEGWSSVTINHPDGCVVVDSVFVPLAPLTIENTLVIPISCSGDSSGSITLSPSDLFSPVNFEWSNGTNENSLNNLFTGEYWVKYLDSRGCKDSVSFNMEDPLPIQIDATVIPISCASGSNGGFEIDAIGGIAPYYWLINDVQIEDPTTGFIAGSYVIQAVDQNTCESNSISLELIQPEALMVTFSTVSEEIANTFSGTATAHVSGGTPPFSFLWNDLNVQNDSLAVYLNTGWYSVSVSDAMGCSISDSVFVDANMLGINQLLNHTNSFSVYPNPTNGILNVSNTAEQILIYDVLGQLLDTQNNAQQIDLNPYASGFYLLSLRRGKEIERFKVQKIGN
jgi:hypothetical protein